MIRCLAIGDVDDKGMVTVFFELNGQPRRIKVPDRAHGASAAKARRKAEPGNDAHVGAPMPGVVSTLAVAAGQAVKAGDVLLSIEAMKMETALHAERDGTIAEVLVQGRRPDRRQGSAGGVRVARAFCLLPVQRRHSRTLFASAVTGSAGPTAFHADSTRR